MARLRLEVPEAVPEAPPEALEAPEDELQGPPIAFQFKQRFEDDLRGELPARGPR